MSLLIILFGVFVILAGMFLVFKPDGFLRLMERHANEIWLYLSAIIVRLILGTLLITEADISRYPLAITILGWISIIAALFFAAIGRSRFRQLMTWVLAEVKPYTWIGGVLSFFFGLFLIYAFV